MPRARTPPWARLQPARFRLLNQSPLAFPPFHAIGRVTHFAAARVRTGAHNNHPHHLESVKSFTLLGRIATWFEVSGFPAFSIRSAQANRASHKQHRKQ